MKFSVSSIFEVIWMRIGPCCVHLAVLLLAPAVVAGEESVEDSFFSKHRRFLALYHTEVMDVELSAKLEPARESSGNDFEYDSQQYDFRSELLTALSDSLFLRSGLKYRYLEYDFSFSENSPLGDSAANLVLHRGLGQFGAGVFLGSGVMLTGFVEVGLASDFEDAFDTDAIVFQYQAEIVFEINPAAQLLLGARRGDDLEEDKLVPLIGLRLRGREGRLRVNATLPLAVDISYRPLEYLEFYGLAALSGQTYQIEMRNLDGQTQERSTELGVFSRRLGAGVRVLPADVLVIQFEAGVGIDDSLEIAASESLDEDIEPGPYLGLSIGLSL